MRNKSTLSILMNICVVSACMLLSGCDQNSDINKDGKIVFGTSSTYPPFEFSKDGILIGFDIDIAKEIAKRMNKKAEFKDMQFEALIQCVNQGMIDLVISAMSQTDERKQIVDMSNPYYSGSDIIVLYKEPNKFNDAKDFSNKKVACQTGSTMERWTKKNAPKDAEIIPIDWPSHMIESLKASKIDFIVIDGDVTEEIFKKNPNLNFSKKVVAQSTEGFSIVAKKGSKIIKQINDIINDMKNDGTIENIKKKWIKK